MLTYAFFDRFWGQSKLWYYQFYCSLMLSIHIIKNYGAYVRSIYYLLFCLYTLVRIYMRIRLFYFIVYITAIMLQINGCSVRVHTCSKYFHYSIAVPVMLKLQSKLSHQMHGWLTPFTHQNLCGLSGATVKINLIAIINIYRTDC